MPGASTSEVVEEAFRKEQLGDGSRRARLSYRKQQHAQDLEREEIRASALAASRRKAKEEEDASEAEAARARSLLEAAMNQMDNMDFIKADVVELREVVPSEEFRSFLVDTVTICLKPHEKFRALKMKLQYPKTFPKEPVLVDLESSCLHPEFVAKLQAGADKKVAEIASSDLGHYQGALVYKMIHNLLHCRAATAYHDIKQIRQLFKDTDCSLNTLKEKLGIMTLQIQEGQHYMELRLTVDQQYPASPPKLEVLDHSLPPELVALFTAQAMDKASRLAQPPHVVGIGLGGAMARAGAGTGCGSKNSRKASAKQTMDSAKFAAALVDHAHDAAQAAQEKQKKILAAFQPQPSLFPMVEFLYSECVRPLVLDRCSVCQKRLVPSDPTKMSQVKKNMMPERLHCGHVYHMQCLETYISNPPFSKGCNVCGQNLSHHKFCTDPKLLESRWAFKQARQREIDDVAEAFSL